MKEETKEINGRTITYSDVIHHHTDIKLKFMDRIRVLFGRTIYTSSEIYSANECKIVGSTAKTNVAPIFKPRRRKGFLYGAGSINETN